MSEAFIRLRGHHLVCLLSFVGKGYGQASVENFIGIAKEISAGRNNIQIVDCADDICRPRRGAPCPQAEECSCRGDEIAQFDKMALSLLNQEGAAFLPLQPCSQMQFSSFFTWQMRKAMISGRFAPLCQACDWWERICKSVVENKFKDVILHPPRFEDGSLKKGSFSLWPSPKQS